jgi:hypothetical protein
VIAERYHGRDTHRPSSTVAPLHATR